MRVPAATASRKFKMPRRFDFSDDAAAQDRHRQDPQARPCAKDLWTGKETARTRMNATYGNRTTPRSAAASALSALVAALPIFTLLVLLGVMRKPAWMA